MALGHKDRLDTVRKEQEQRYREWKSYFDYCEKDMQGNPVGCRHQKAYYKAGKPRGRGKDALLFPVEIVSGRVSFGKIQFLITPYGVNKFVLGGRWVEKKMLVMQHDSEFSRFELSVVREEA